MAASSGDRAKAAKLRLKVKANEATADERAWLDRYETSVAGATIRKAKALPSGDRHTPTAPPVAELRAAPRELPAPAPIHETLRLDDNLTAAEFSWTPTVPTPDPEAPASSGAPPAAGAPPPPAAGAPLVDPEAPAQGQGTELGAAQFAALVMLVDKLGIAAAMELLPPVEALPAALQSWHAMLTSDKLHDEALAKIEEAAKRWAITNNVKGIPMADGLLVFGSMAGSIGALVAAYRQRQEQARKAPREPATAPTSAPSAPAVDMPDVLKGIWE